MNHSVEKIEPSLYNGAVADEIIASLNDAISDRGRATLVLAGGSTPSAVYRLLSIPPRLQELDWSKVTLFWGDERFVAQSDDKSNFKMVNETLLMQLGRRAPKYLAVDTSLKNAEDAAQAYADTIRREVKVAAGEVPVFDLVLLGIGEDGHTASLFPYSPLVTKNDGICFAAAHPSDGSMRVSISPAIIKAAHRVAFMVKGQSKAEIVHAVLEGSGNVEQYPANIFREATGQVTWFIDSEAASKLTPGRN
jgi:6-phosphogluconolactonase